MANDTTDTPNGLQTNAPTPNNEVENYLNALDAPTTEGAPALDVEEPAEEGANGRSPPSVEEVRARLAAMKEADATDNVGRLDRFLETGGHWVRERELKRITLLNFSSLRGEGWGERQLQMAASCSLLPRDSAWKSIGDAKRAVQAKNREARKVEDAAKKAEAAAAEKALTDEQRAARDLAAARETVGMTTWTDQANACASVLGSHPVLVDEVVDAQVGLIEESLRALSAAMRLAALERAVAALKTKIVAVRRAAKAEVES